MAIQPPQQRSNDEDMGNVNGYHVRYSRTDRAYTISGAGGALTVRLGAVSSLAMALGHIERDSDRRHFLGDDGPVGDGPTLFDDDLDEDPDAGAHDPDDVADLIAHDMRVHAAVFGPGVQVFRP